MNKQFTTFCHTVEKCRKCPRLVAYREEIVSPGRKRESTDWRKPVPGFGDLDAFLMIIGLAPSAQGANRTGRIFTGDPTARFLIPALHQCGFASQSTSEARDDGLVLKGCYMTAAVKCVPPKNRPTGAEFKACHPYLVEEFAFLKKLRGVLALGKDAFEAALRHFGAKATFCHGARVELPNIILYGSFHPSPQNTYTKKLTEKMLTGLLEQTRRECAPPV